MGWVPFCDKSRGLIETEIERVREGGRADDSEGTAGRGRGSLGGGGGVGGRVRV